MDPDTHFIFGTHPQHGYVAAFASDFPSHLADWYLTRVQFEHVPGEPGLYRLTEPEHDGLRRTRQAAQDLHAQSFAVHVDADVALAAANPLPLLRPNGTAERRRHIARAAAGRSLQHSAAPTTAQASARPIPPKPAYAPTAHLTVHAGGRSR
ncbi:hypothetical protein ACIF80_36195 [Streptomyces sp. NPDC085927]|uniref:hypothetical protein n=1 Tax=Streptomyces sp. NPDC085927 TaxID=3365738 RepID=UPI0037D1099A